MNTRAIKAIVRKDIKVILQSKAVLIPIIIVPLIFYVIIPAAAASVPGFFNVSEADLNEFGQFLTNMPAGMQAELAGLNPAQTIVTLMIVYFMAPMFLIVPLMVANVIAADSFAGEKERKTLEALLYTPTTDRELLLGKMLSALIPALLVTLVGFLLYGIAANLAGWPVMGRIFFPNAMWLVLLFWVVPAAAGLGLGSMVVVSNRVSSFQEAYQMGGSVVLPIVLLVMGQAFGVIYFNIWMAVVLGLVLWILDAILYWYGVRTFQRGELIARL